MTDSHTVTNDFPPVYDEKSRILILGSMPSEASRAAGFYYMHPRNRFWRVMSALFGVDFSVLTAEEKAAALNRRHVALYDVIRSCEIHRSSDASIRRVESANIREMIEKSEINHIFLNGRTAYGLFLRHFSEYAAMATLLPSTSPANAQVSLAALTEIWGAVILPRLELSN